MVDFSMPSDCKRLYVIDTQSGKILINTYVAHGSGSGTRLPTVFSNEEESHQSSLGAMVIGKTYHGKHGLSLHLAGLEPGINNNVAARSIVMHSASYVTPSYIQAHHSAGRSWGCFAVGPSMLPIRIPMLQGGSMLFAYAPAEQQDQNFNS